MTVQELKETVPLPDGVTAAIDKAKLTLTGEKGSVARGFLHPKVSIEVKENQVVFVSKAVSKNEKKVMKTFCAHVRNLCKGVSQGHEYKLRICSGHFPMNVSVKGDMFEVKNFIGEVVPRTLKIRDGVSVKLSGELVTVEGVDKEVVSQTAASIEQLTRRNGFDRRVFQDGIYIVEKDGKKIV